MMRSRCSTTSLPIGLAVAAVWAGVLVAASAGCKRPAQDKTKESPSSPATSPGGSGKPGAGIKVGVVFDIGGLGDKSFNDAANRGMLKAKAELGVQTQVIEPGEGSDRESALRQRAAAGDDLVIAIGYIFSDDITKLAAEFPGTKFACLDYTLPEGTARPPANLVGLRFREHEGSFLVGAIAGRVTRTKQLGFVGGMKGPLIHKFEVGFEAGMKQVCPDCTMLSAYAGTEPKAFADPTKGKELALTQYARGADIIYHASGKTGDGVFDAAREQKKFAIGVDSDQFQIAPCCVLTSMIKKSDVAIYDTIKKVVDHKFTGGVYEFGLAEDGVGFVYDANNKAFIPQAVVDEVNGLAKQIAAGTIKVPSE
jgi:basic membrane protein A and related proteins